jgi:hypothetical protein
VWGAGQSRVAMVGVVALATMLPSSSFDWQDVEEGKNYFNHFKFKEK